MEDRDREELKSATYNETKQELENEAILKYEKNAKPYRKTFIPKVVELRCQKCGSPYTLTKHIVDGKEYWFCKACLYERMREISKKKTL